MTGGTPISGNLHLDHPSCQAKGFRLDTTMIKPRMRGAEGKPRPAQGGDKCRAVASQVHPEGVHVVTLGTSRQVLASVVVPRPDRSVDPWVADGDETTNRHTNFFGPWIPED